ncbi:hypothetical protein Tco_1424925 [Tanacetum coccineum]
MLHLMSATTLLYPDILLGRANYDNSTIVVEERMRADLAINGLASTRYYEGQFTSISEVEDDKYDHETPDIKITEAAEKGRSY